MSKWLRRPSMPRANTSRPVRCSSHSRRSRQRRRSSQDLALDAVAAERSPFGGLSRGHCPANCLHAHLARHPDRRLVALAFDARESLTLHQHPDRRLRTRSPQQVRRHHLRSGRLCVTTAEILNGLPMWNNAMPWQKTELTPNLGAIDQHRRHAPRPRVRRLARISALSLSKGGSAHHLRRHRAVRHRSRPRPRRQHRSPRRRSRRRQRAQHLRLPRQSGRVWIWNQCACHQRRRHGLQRQQHLGAAPRTRSWILTLTGPPVAEVLTMATSLRAESQCRGRAAPKQQPWEPKPLNEEQLSATTHR
jgi:hypothetical protein